MRKNIQYIASAALILVLAASCNKGIGVPGGENQIRFAPRTVETKAMINDDAGLVNETFAVVGLLNDAANFQNSIKYADGAWNYVTDATYIWLPGTHKFFGYTDGMGTLTANKLTASKVLTTAAAAQTDLLYSEVVTSTDVDWKASHTMGDPVPLNFKHLFSAVSITVKNCLDADKRVVVNSVSKPAIPNSGSAEVDFTTMVVDAETGDATNVPVVTYSAPVVNGDFVTTAVPANIELAANGELDVLNAGATAKSYQMVWPQTLAKGAVTVTVSYTVYDGADDTTGKSYTNKTVSLPAVTWLAGQKYDYVLQILPTDVRLTFVVQPWDSVAVGEIDTEDGSINMSNVTWQNTKVKLTQDGEEVNTLDMDAFSVYMYYKPYYKDNTGAWTQYTANNGYFPAQGFFTVNYPLEGLFKIDLIQASYWADPVPEGMYEIFIYDDTLETPAFRAINPDGEDLANWHTSTGANTIYFQVRATADVPADREKDYKAQIDIWFKGTEEGAEWVSAYSEIRANYACVIQKTN